MPNLLTHLTIGDQKTTINSVHYIVGTGSTTGTWLGTDSSIDEYYDGLTIAYKVPVAGASTTTLNITGSAGTALGAKTVYRNASSKITTHYAVGSVVLLVYMSTGSYPGWHCVDYDKDTTYSNASLGQGYGTCATAAATTEKAVTLSNYALTVGGVVAVKFTYAVPASATLKINSKTAKAIRYRGAAITAGIIKAGDTATFIYDGTYYHLLAIDNAVATATQSTNGLMSSADKTKLDGLSFGVYGWDTEYEVPKIIELLSPEDWSANNFMGNALSFTIDGGATTAASFAIQAAKVAKTGSYNDLSDKPTIPSAYTLPTASSSVKGGIKVGTGLSMSGDVMSVSYGTSASTACVGNDSRLSDARTPKSHASSGTSYGVGTTSNYGHVKIQNGDLHTKTHTDGIAAGLAHTHSLYFTTAEAEALDLRKQEKLESGTNIKTINGTSLLGSGNISISAGSSYTLPTASSSTKGGIKVGTGLSMSSETMSVSYGTSSTTAAVGNDGRFGKVSISKMEYRDTGSPTNDTKYYKFGFIDASTPGDNDIVGTTNAAITYSPGWYGSNQGFVHGDALQVKSLSVSPTGDNSIFWSNNTSTGFGTDVIVTAGKVLKFNKINIPTSSGGSTYGTGSSGKVLKSNGTTVYWGDDNNTTYTFNGAVSTIKDSNLTASRALIANSSGKVAVSAVTSTELGYLDGVTSSIQTQLNGKLTQSTADARYALKSEIGGGGTTSVQILTRAEYNALTTISSDVLYIVRG